MPRLTPLLLAAGVLIAPALAHAAAPPAKSGPFVVSAPLATKPLPLTQKSGMAPAVIDGYAALVDPAAGRRYVQRSGGAVTYGLKLEARFTDHGDGNATIVADACSSSTCGVEVDDAGVKQSLNSPRTTGFGYVVVFHADWNYNNEPLAQRGVGDYHGMPITSVVTYNPGRYSFQGMTASWIVNDTPGDRGRSVRMEISKPSFAGMPDF